MPSIEAADPEHDLVLDQKRCGPRAASALSGIRDFDVPRLAAGLLIERNEMMVRGRDKNETEAGGESDRLARSAAAFGGLVGVGPDETAGAGVQCDDGVLCRRQEKNAVDDQRRRTETILARARGKRPSRQELPDILSIDLIETAVAPSLVVAKIALPVVRGRIGLARIRPRDRENQNARHNNRKQCAS